MLPFHWAPVANVCEPEAEADEPEPLCPPLEPLDVPELLEALEDCVLLELAEAEPQEADPDPILFCVAGG